MKHWTLLDFTTVESQKLRKEGQLSSVELALQGTYFNSSASIRFYIGKANKWYSVTTHNPYQRNSPRPSDLVHIGFLMMSTGTP